MALEEFQASVDGIDVSQGHQIHAPPFRGRVNRLDGSVSQGRPCETEVPGARVMGMDMQIHSERAYPPLRL